MQQFEVDRAVARATGESVATVKRLGFLLADPQANLDPEAEALGPHVLDWDEIYCAPSATRERRPADEPATA